jgi:hypothetical protein
LPLNTALFEPPLDPELPALDSDGDSDDADENKGEEGKKNSVRNWILELVLHNSLDFRARDAKTCCIVLPVNA